MKIKVKQFFGRHKLILASFAFPVLIMVLAFAVTEIYPFGGNQIAVIDMYHQYVPFLGELQYKLQEGGSLFYTWNGAGGSNFWNLIAYYGASPLNLLLVLFPKKFLMEGITLILVIKVGLAGSFMAMYLKYADKARDWGIVAFATMYALCSYVLAYYWCIMWMDAVMLLPLCILGLNRLIDDGRAVLYTVSLALIVFSNYYMAIMVCIFIMFYYPVLYFIKNRARGAKKCVTTTARAVFFSLLAVVMAAVMLLPAYISMQSTYYISMDMPENTAFYSDALDVFNQLLPYSELTFREGLPNLYCGIFTVIMLVFYLTSKAFSTREKVLNVAFLAFMFISLNINKLDFIWHGFHFPNQLPYRYTFVICFVLIGMAYKAFRVLDNVKIRHIWILFASGVAYYLFAQKLMTENIDDMNLFFYGGIAWLALYCSVLLFYRRDLISKGAMILLIVVLVTAESVSAVCSAFDTIGNTQRDTYYENYDDITGLVESRSDEFARMEINGNYILNCPAFYHYKGLSQFSSSVNADTTALMEAIGLEGEPGKNRFNYNQTDPVTNAMLNVKYLISKNLPLDDPDFVQVDRQGNSYLYESRYPLSIGYMAGNEIRTWDTHSGNPFEVLNSYVRSATSNRYDSVFESAGKPQLYTANIKAENSGSGKVSTQTEDQSKKSEVVMRYKATATQKYYVFVEADNADEIIANENIEDLDEIQIRSDCGSIVNIGTVREGEEFTVTVKFDAGDAGDITCHVCSLDYEAWDGAYEMLSEHMLEVTDSGDRFIRGTIDAGDGGMLVTSVPYERGWTLKVDGVKKEIHEKTGGVFISTSLDAGEHEIELSFTPPGIIAGSIATCISILILAAYTILRKRRLMKLRARLVSTLSEAAVSQQEVSDCNKTL